MQRETEKKKLFGTYACTFSEYCSCLYSWPVHKLGYSSELWVLKDMQKIYSSLSVKQEENLYFFFTRDTFRIALAAQYF